MVKKITNEEKEMRARELRWRAEEDARIMAQYQEIMKKTLKKRKKINNLNSF